MCGVCEREREILRLKEQVLGLGAKMYLTVREETVHLSAVVSRNS